MKVSSNLYQITLPTPMGIGPVHTYLLIEDRITLFDAGIYTEEAWNSFNEQLSKLHLKVDDIDQIILTHHHPDHTGLVTYFRDRIPIAAHPNVDVWLTRDEEYFTRYEKVFREMFVQWGVPRSLLNEITSLKGSLNLSGIGKVTLPVQHLDRVPGHEDWIALYTPGHATTHVAFLHEQERILIGGDLLLEDISSIPLLEGPYKDEQKRTEPLVQYRDSLEQLKQLEVCKIYPGHGPIIENVNELIDERLQAFQKRSNLVKKLLQHKRLTAYDLCKKLYPHQRKGQLLLTMSQTIGCIDLLIDAGEVIEYENEDVLYYNLRKI